MTSFVWGFADSPLALQILGDGVLQAKTAQVAAEKARAAAAEAGAALTLVQHGVAVLERTVRRQLGVREAP